MNKIYLQVVALILSVIIVLGFVAPWLISAESNIAVILGVIVLIVYGALLIKYVPKIVKTIKTFVDEKNVKK